jgi:LysM repeat protein
MKRISFLVLLAVLAAAPVFGQDALQQQIDKLSGQIQDLMDAQALQAKRISALEKSVSDLSDKVNTPQVSDSASREDLRQLAQQVQEIDKKRQADRDLILKEIEKLGRIGSAPSHKSSAPDTTATASAADSTPATPKKGYEYEVRSGDTIAAIAKAYADQGVKVTIGDILKANPKVDPKKLFVGQKIFIPDPTAK